MPPYAAPSCVGTARIAAGTAEAHGDWRERRSESGVTNPGRDRRNRVPMAARKPPSEKAPEPDALPSPNHPSAGFAIAPPIEPMLAKLADELPAGGMFMYEPKWDGFRAIVFRGDSDVFIQSRDLRPLDRYFPELHVALLEQLPKGCVIDGEIVITTPHGLDFDALQMRLHPAESRVAKLAQATPASFVAFDLLAAGGHNTMAAPQQER